MSNDIATLDVNESNQYKINFVIRQLAERLARKPSGFSAHKNGTGQTGIADDTLTKITFGTELYDTGSNFASSTWTPASGLVQIEVQVYFNGVLAGGFSELHLYKNGASFKRNFLPTSLGADFILALSVTDNASGADTYEIYAEANATTTWTANGLATSTWFMGTNL